METHTSVRQVFALAKADGSVVSVADVQRGLACGCVCPACGTGVVARQGAVRAWHFAHASGGDCEQGAESALHLAAKAAVGRAGGIVVPGLECQKTCRLEDGRQATASAVAAPAWVDLPQVALEVRIPPYVVDVLGTDASGDGLAVEIAVTHPTGPEKAQALLEAGVRAIEVRVPREIEPDWEELTELVCRDLRRRHWLAAPQAGQLANEALRRAREAADQLPVPPRETRFRRGHQFVQLREYPFATTLWFAYDPAVLDVVRTLARTHGGRYQPRYRSWRFPSPAARPLVDTLLAEGFKDERSLVRPHGASHDLA